MPMRAAPEWTSGCRKCSISLASFFCWPGSQEQPDWKRIRGCSEASSAILAREDCGDTSAPERYEKQLAILDSHPDVVLVSCAARHAGPAGEELFVVRRDGDDVRRSLISDDIRQIHGLGA